MATSPTSGPPGRILLLPIAILTTIALLAVDALWGQLSRNGYLASIQPLLDGHVHQLPDSQHLILRRYTGVAAVDGLLALLNVFFANVTDGSRPQLSAFGAYFAGQLLCFTLVLVVEGQRAARWSGVVLR